MALRTEDKSWISQEIAKQIEEHLNPHGWRKLVNFAKTWIPLGAALSVLIALLGLAGAGWNFAFTRIDKQARFETQTTSTLDRIDGSVRALQNSVALLQAQVANLQYSKLTKKELVSRKPEFLQLKATLAATPKETPNYWPKSFDLIALLSQAQAQLEGIWTLPLSELKDVRIMNSSPQAFAIRKQNVLLKNLIEGVYFENSIIHFDRSVRLVNDTFVNCVFILPADPNPPENLQKIGETLLASDLSNVKIGS